MVDRLRSGKVTVGDLTVSVSHRVSRRARRITLRVSGLDGQVTVTRPWRVGEAEAQAFVAEKSDWLARVLSDRPDMRSVAVGEVMTVDGVPRRIEAVSRRGLSDGVLGVAAGRPVGPQVAEVLKWAARRRLSSAVGGYAAKLGREPGRITLRDTRSRWGSCSSAGDLMFSWRLILAPTDVLDYVAAHEVAHLERMDHSAAYWDVVRRLKPGYAAPRDWLRREGAGLRRWRFDD